ncbi:MAG: hypothetical protein KJ621_09440 [Proteobacteria bacterium]|nr:hypothetical protein [Pseudomonadota bacterium]MBU1743074.1 hypothetical protein [Pseudomonadota bacterium]
MKRIATFLFVLALVLTLGAAPGPAQDKAQSPLNVTTVEATAYEQLPVFALGGVQEMLKLDGKLLVAVNVTALPQFTPTMRRIRISHRDIVVVTPQGETLGMIGFFRRFGQFEVGANNLSAYKWGSRVKPVNYNAVFAVPKGVKDLTFKLGAYSTKIQVPSKVQTAAEAASAVKINLLGVRLVPQVKTSRRVARGRVETTVTNLYGALLEVRFNLTPLRANGMSPTHFFWFSRWIGLIDAAGTYLAPVGERFMGKLTLNVSHNLSKGSAGWRSTTATFYFAVPKNFKQFKLTYCNRPVASGEVK